MASNDGKTPEGEMVSQAAQAEGGQTKGSNAAQLQSQVTREKNAAEVDAELAAKMAEGVHVTQDEAALAQSRETRAPGAGPAPDTIASQAKSQADKEVNFTQAADVIGEKMAKEPENITTSDAAYLESREHRATGVRPPPDSLSAEAKRMAAANEKSDASSNVATTSSEQLAGIDRSDLTRSQQSVLDRATNFQDKAEEVKAKMEVDPNSVTKDDARVLHSREQRAFGTTEKGGISSQAQKIVSEKEKAGEA